MKNSFIQTACMSVLALIAQSADASKPSSDTQSSVPSIDNFKYLKERVTILEHKFKEEQKNAVIDPVLALPQVNFRPKYDTASAYNQDLALLKMRKMYDSAIKKHHILSIPYPHIEIGGSLIGLGTLRKSPNTPPLNGKWQSDLNLSGANFNVTSEMMDALMGALRISYNPSGSEKFNETAVTTRVANSSIFLNTGFLTWGNLNKFPYYASIGQMFIPFGEYGTSLLTAPLPARVGRLRQRPFLVGFQQPGGGLNASLFAFKGDTIVNKNSGVVDNGGGNVEYDYSNSWFKLKVGGSAILNVADAGGMQNTGPSTIVSDGGDYVDNDYLSDDDQEEALIDGEPVPVNSFRGFGADEQIAHRVPAIDARARFSIVGTPISFYGEMVKSTQYFSVDNLSFNDEGARPSAWNGEGSLNFSLFGYDSAVTLGYGRSSQALALNIPESSTGITYKAKIGYATLSIGYQYDIAYPDGTEASGQNLPVSGSKFVGTVTRTLTAQLNGRF